MAIDWRRVAFGVIAVAAGAVAGYFGQPLMAQNSGATDVIVTVFSILAGFLIAIMAILGDPGLLLTGSWRVASAQKRTVSRQLLRQELLFYIYLVTLGLALFAALVDKVWPEVTAWTQGVLLGLGVTGFILSLGLPAALRRIQQDRIDQETERRKKSSAPQKS